VTDESIWVMVQEQGDCDGTEYWILVDDKGYIWAELNKDAVKAHDLRDGAVYEMKLISP